MCSLLVTRLHQSTVASLITNWTSLQSSSRGTTRSKHRVSVIAATPPYYRVIERARPRTGKNEMTVEHNYGGICAFVRCCLKVKLIDFPLYPTIELSLFIFNQPIASLLLIVYPPGSKPLTTDFIKEFGDLLERSSSYNQSLHHRWRRQCTSR